jgi:hypothetical protein
MAEEKRAEKQKHVRRTDLGGATSAMALRDGDPAEEKTRNMCTERRGIAWAYLGRDLKNDKLDFSWLALEMLDQPGTR